MTYNSEEHIVALLESLRTEFEDTPGGVVIVVDNGSTDGTLALLDARKDITVVRSENTGFAGGVNTGVRASPGGSTILVLNPDATVSPGAVSAMQRALATPGVGIVAPRMLESDGSLSPSIRREPSLLRAGGFSFTRLPAFAERVEDPRAYIDEHTVDWAVGAALLIDRECFDQLGGFDESFFLYSEETDFCLRARDAGWHTLYTPTAEVMHVGGASGESATTHTMKMINRVRLFARRNPPLPAWLYFSAAALTELRRGLLGHSASWVALRALLRPSLRPAQLGLGTTLLPR